MKHSNRTVSYFTSRKAGRKAGLRTLAMLLALLLLMGAVAGCTPSQNDPSGDTETIRGGTGTPTDPVTDSATEPATDPATEAPTAPEATPDTQPPAPETELHVVDGGQSAFTILYPTDDGQNGLVAALVLRDRIQEATGVKLSVAPDAEDATGCVIRLGSGEGYDIGDCGYTIAVDDTSLTLSATSLAGFDNAIDRLMADADTAAGEMDILLDYAACETVDSGAGYTLDGEDFNPSYVHAPFYNDKNDGAVYVTNAMWHMFGAVDDGQSLVYRFGNEPTYFEWVSEKIMWSGDADYINDLKGKIQMFPQTSTGYMWSWSTYPYWQVSDTYCIHYDGTFRYIAAVYDVIAWENSTDFLSAVDNTTAGGEYGEYDASKGRTVLEKAEAAWDYILYQLKGESGIVQLTEQSVYLNADGSQRFDLVKATGQPCWNNTGLPRSAASNYWDNLCFGNYDAYENALFYEAAQAMIGIYGMLGGEYLEKIPALTTLCETIRENYNKYFWSEETGRYIACVDTEGNKVDYGLTFLNFEALKYGLGGAEEAISVFDWIDGRRIVEGDKRTGFDILSYLTIMRYTGKMRAIKTFDETMVLAPVVNTVPINNKENQQTGAVWWHGPAGIDPFGSAAYGKHCENGGYIFYPVFYELMARTRYLGAQSTTDRLNQIARVYEFNRLVSDEAASGSTNWLEGLIGEFPESGLVPTVYLYGLLGISAESDGFHVSPAFNRVYETMGVTSTTYGGRAYGVEVSRDGSMTVTCLDKEIDMALSYTPGRFTDFTVTTVKTDGSTDTQTLTVDEGGVLHVTLQGADVEKVVIAPVLA